jgi:hypothetical protein
MDGNPVMEDDFQEGVLAELARDLYWDGPTPDDMAHFAGVGVATAPGEEVTDDHQVRARRASRALACCHGYKRIGCVGVEALALGPGVLHSAPRALSSDLEAVDQGHPRLWRQGTAEAGHAEPVAPVAEVPRAHLLAVKVGYVGICLAVLAGLVAQLAEVRATCDCQQLGFGSWGL